MCWKGRRKAATTSELQRNKKPLKLPSPSVASSSPSSSSSSCFVRRSREAEPAALLGATLCAELRKLQLRQRRRCRRLQSLGRLLLCSSGEMGSLVGQPKVFFPFLLAAARTCTMNYVNWTDAATASFVVVLLLHCSCLGWSLLWCCCGYGKSCCERREAEGCQWLGRERASQATYELVST